MYESNVLYIVLLELLTLILVSKMFMVCTFTDSNATKGHLELPRVDPCS